MAKHNPGQPPVNTLAPPAGSRGRLLRWTPFLIIGAALAFGVWLLTRQTPLFVDDLMSGYVFQGWFVEKITAPKLTSFTQIIGNLGDYYMLFRGRVIAQGLVQVFMLYGKSYFNVLNALIFAGIAYLVYDLTNFGKKPSWRLFLLIAAVFWFFTPDFVSTALWMSGSLCVAWPVFFVLLFLVPYRRLASDGLPARRRPLLAAAMVPLGFVAGAFHEHSFGLSIGFAVLAVLAVFIRRQKVPLWAFAGLLSTLAGTAFVLLSPGSRAETVRQYGMSPARLFLDRFPGNLLDAVGMSFQVTKWFLAFLAALAFWLVIDTRRRENAARPSKKQKNAQTQQKWRLRSFADNRFGLLVPALFFACAAATTLITAALPYVDARLFFPVFTAWALVLFSLLAEAAERFGAGNARSGVTSKVKYRKVLLVALPALICLGMLLDFGREYSIYRRYAVVYDGAVQAIEQSISSGEKDIVIRKRTDIDAKLPQREGRLRNFTGYWTITALGSDPQSIENRWVAYALGADTIRSVE